MEKKKIDKRLYEAANFIESDTMRMHLLKEIREGRYVGTEEDLCSIVFNSFATLDEKQAFLLEYPELPVAIDMIKRFEAVKRYVQEQHENEVYVLIIDDRFYGVYKEYAVAKERFEEIKMLVNEYSEISIEMYDTTDSMFRGRLLLDKNLDIVSFDFNQTVIKELNIWNNADTDRVINKYIELPIPFKVGDIVTTKRSLDTFKVVRTEPIIEPEFDEEPMGYDMVLWVVPYYGEAAEDNMEDLKDIDAELVDAAEERISIFEAEIVNADK